MSIGGDHLVSLPILRALAKEKPLGFSNQAEPEKNNEPYKTALTLRDIQICKNVKNIT